MVSLVRSQGAPTLRAMLRPGSKCAWLLIAVIGVLEAAAQAPASLPGTQLLEPRADFSREMVAGIDRFAMRELERAVTGRSSIWNRDHSSPESYQNSMRRNRDNLRVIIGAVDERVAMTGLELVGST